MARVARRFARGFDNDGRVYVTRVVFGLPMYNSERFVGEIISSLLAQDFRELAIVAVDDDSPDATFDVATSYAARDNRLVVERNPARLGMIANWNRTLELARELFPEFEYFAFASDNDLREASWVSTLVQMLEAHPEAALAYSRFGTTDGTPEKTRWLFDTRDISDPVERRRITTEQVRAGPVMYGLHRRRTLDAAGPVPDALLSDVLFLSHLSLYGTFVQAPEVLWFRGERRTGWSSHGQRRALFAQAPAHAYLPVSLQHTRWLLLHMVLGDLRPATLSRRRALGVVVRYQIDWWLRHVRRKGAAWTKRRAKQRKRWTKRRNRTRRRITRALKRFPHLAAVARRLRRTIS